MPSLVERVRNFGRLLEENRQSFRNLRHDIDHALDHASDFHDEPLRSSDFEMVKVNCLKIDDLWRYDDLSAWVDLDDGELSDLSRDELISELEWFRGRRWAQTAVKWLDGGIPAIVIVVTPRVTTIGDGRGRVNFAVGMGMECVPAVVLTHKDADEYLPGVR